MTLEQIRSSLPDWAKDLKLNLQNALTTPGMTPRQIWGTALATAMAARNAALLRAIAAEAAHHLTPAEVDAARMAASLMAMNNIYYRFVHLVHTPEYKTMPAKLRMTGMASHGTDPVDFELWSLAVSAVTGCGMCLESHEKALLERGASKELIQNAVRIAAIVHAGAVTLDAIAAEGAAVG